MHLAFITGMPGGIEILIILFVVLLLFGGKKLPELARSLGKSLGEFRKGREESGMDETKATQEDTQKLDSTDSAEDGDPKKT